MRILIALDADILFSLHAGTSVWDPKGYVLPMMAPIFSRVPRAGVNRQINIIILIGACVQVCHT